MLTVKQQKAVLKQFFTDISPEDFRERLRKYCPEVLSKKPAVKQRRARISSPVLVFDGQGSRVPSRRQRPE